MEVISSIFRDPLVTFLPVLILAGIFICGVVIDLCTEPKS